jgi:CPA2 family monovalent cation:H+ antiporter-2
MVVLLPSLVAGGQGLLGELALAAVKAVGVVLGAYLVGVRLVPLALRRAAVSRTRELFVLGVVALALGTAVMTQLAGLSLAFGAFLAGLVVAESEFRTQVIAEVLPLRDLFASIFFVSIGMLIDPRLLLSEAGLIAGVGAIVVLVKFGVVAAIVLLLGMPGRVAVLAGLSLAQVGEFSFVLAGVGVQRGAIPSSVFDLTLALALVTIVLSPSLMRTGPGLLKLLQRAPWLGGRLADPAEPARRSDELRHHAVICGYGRVGRELADALQARGLRFLVIEYNPDVVRRLRDQKIPVVYGDAANPAVLEHAHLEHARLLALLMPDARAAEVATRHARAMNPRLDIVARGGSIEELDRLRQAGATEVVQPEFEAGVEVIRHALHRFGVGGMELASAVSGRRNAYYRRNVESETP